ncbi:MAG: pilin, partial [Patescibacteria group bacterium]
MNKLIFTILALCIFSPSFALALDYSDCDAGTAQCTCTPDDQIGLDQTTVDSIAKCQEACRTIEPFQDSFGGTITGFSVQCSISGTITTLSQGGLDTPIDYDSAVVGVTDPYQDTYPTPNLGVEIPGLVFTPAVKTAGSVTSNYLGEYIQAVMKFVFPAASLLAVIFIMIGGLQYIMARGKPDSIGKAKTKIRNAIVGVVLLFCAFTIAQVVDP